MEAILAQRATISDALRQRVSMVREIAGRCDMRMAPCKEPCIVPKYYKPVMCVVDERYQS